MEDREDREARARRAAARRATWAAPVCVALGAPESPSHDELSAEQRLAALWHLTLRIWSFAGRPVERVPRHELPGEVFEIIDGIGSAPRRLP